MIQFIRTVLFLIIIAVSLQTTAQKAPGKNGNPLWPGWYADPEVALFDKTAWIYPTYSAPYEQQVFLDAFSSADLHNWKKHPHVIDTAAVKWARKAIWAPAIIQKDNRYFLFFSANDVHEGEIGGIGVAVADRPEGPFTDYLGKPLVGEIHNGAQPIDQFVFHDRDGSYYMIYGGWGHCNMVRLKPDFTGLLPFADGQLYKEITPKGYVEGPVLFTRNNKYYFMWSEGGWGGPDYRVAYAMSDSLSGPFERIGTILKQDSTVATGAGHHSVLQLPGRDEWYIIYHRRPLGETDANHRVTCMDRMYFDEKGFIQPVKITNEGVEKIRL
jgi:beta-xylosidase